MKYHYIGSVISDPGPGMSDRWDVFIGRDRQGFFHASSAGCIGQFKEAAEWINWESGLDDSQEAARLLEGKWGYSKLVKELRS